MIATRLVGDANVLLSAFLRDGVTRELLLHAPLELYAPSWLRYEVERNLLQIAEQKDLEERTVRVLMDQAMKRIQEVPEAVLAQHSERALKRCEQSGHKDAPYVACALAVEADLWTQDRKLAKEAGIRCITTSELKKRFPGIFS